MTQKPIDFDQIRIALVKAIKANTGLECIYSEPESQGAPRPPLPYFSVKFTSPSIRLSGDDHRQVFTGITPTTKWTTGGQRKMVASFQCYARTHEEAYNFMALWQSALSGELLPGALGSQGIAVWVVGNLVDLSQLLNTGYEGRSQMDTTFGLASNFTEDLGEMDTFPTTGTIDTGQGTDTVTETFIA